MDLQLPGMDGTEALRQLRKSPSTRAVPVVAVTAFAMKDDRERALDAGFDGYLEKPISVPALPAQVRSFLRPRRRHHDDDASVLVVDDLPQNVRLLDAVLSPRGYQVVGVGSGEEALAIMREEPPDIVLLDILMPGMDGYEVCRRIREDPATAFLPVVMITASGEQEKLRALEAGADDFVTKPFDQAELLARVRSLIRIKRYHDTIEQQAAELLAWNRELEERVAAQVAGAGAGQPAAPVPRAAAGRAGRRLRRRVVPREPPPRDRRRLLRPAAVHAFAETSEPEEVMTVLSEYHAALGDLILRFEGTLERFAGDGLMVFFNDPLPCDDAALRAIRMAVAMRSRVQDLATDWRRAVTTWASRSASPRASPRWAGSGSRAATTTPRSAASPTSRPGCARRRRGPDPGHPAGARRREDIVVSDPLGAMTLRGFSRQVSVFDVKGLDAARVTS